MSKKKAFNLQCHLCGSDYKKGKVPMELIEGSGHYEETEVYKCKKCGDIVLDSRQLESFRSKVTHFRIRRKLGISGNALVLRIPADIREFCNLTKDDIVEIVPIDKKKFIVEVT